MDHAVHVSLPWLLTVGAPHRAKGAVLPAATHGLHRRPHIPAGGQQVPARRHEPISRYVPPVVHARGPTRDAISDDGRPDHIPSPWTTACAPPCRCASSGKRVAWIPPNATHAPRFRACRPISYPRRALPVWMPMPTTSPDAIVETSIRSSVSSTRQGSPHSVPVAAANTYSQRGVITATPNDKSLGLIRWTREPTITSRCFWRFHVF